MELINFIEAIQEKSKIIVDGLAGREALKVADLLWQAHFIFRSIHHVNVVLKVHLCTKQQETNDEKWGLV